MIELIEAPQPGQPVRVRATGAEGLVVAVFRRHQTADVDLGDGITAELAWSELELLPGPVAPPSGPSSPRGGS